MQSRSAMREFLHVFSASNKCSTFFLWQILNLYPIFNILSGFNISFMKFKLLLSLYYLLTSFLHMEYLERCSTARIYPQSSFLPLPAFADVWNWALRPWHSDWVPKIRQISFTDVTLKRNLCIVILNHPVLLYLQNLGQGLGVSYSAFTHFPSLTAATETLPPTCRLYSSSFREGCTVATHTEWLR